MEAASHPRFVTAAATICLIALAGDALAQGSVASDRAALVALYNATGGPNWTDNTNWLSNEPLGEWYGVETNEQGRVEGLRLGGWDDNIRETVGNGLTGTLPPELVTLAHLRWLTIEGNSLTGSIPAELANLTNLESIQLSQNGLGGPLPPELGVCAAGDLRHETGRQPTT